MELLSKLQTILKDITFDTRAIFTGVFLYEKPVATYSTLRDKEKVISELSGLLVRKVLVSSNDFIEDFKPEFSFAEGKGFGIFVYVVDDSIAIATIVNEKPNFSLLKMTHENAGKKLSQYIEEIKNYDFKTEDNQTPTTVEEVEDKKEQEILAQELSQEKLEEEVSEIEELEKALSEEEAKEEVQEDTNISESMGSVEDTAKVQEEKQVEEETEPQDNVSLEEILGVKGEDSQQIVNIDELIEEIKKEFIKEIGPVGKIIFNKAINSIGIKEKPTVDNINDLINRLSKEIPVEKRRAEFMEIAKKIIAKNIIGG